MKVRVARGSRLTRFALSKTGRVLIGTTAVLAIAVLAVFTYFYSQYSSLIDRKIGGGPFANSAKIFAAPLSVAVGDVSAPTVIAAELRRSGYTESRNNSTGYYQIRDDSIEVFPGPDSYFDQEAGVVYFAGNKISRIVSLRDNTPRNEYQLEPQLITNVSGPNREKRRLVRFDDIPRVLVDAVISAEDKRFFQHAGFDPIRILKAVYVDVREGRKEQGASTLSQQLARSFFLVTDKSWRRKLAEVVITLQLEQKLSKEQIFEYYANQIYLGWRGAYQIHGFGEAAEAYFGKDLSQVTLPEAAALAGQIQRPAYTDPYRHPERLTERRNIVLLMMRQNDLISDSAYAQAVAAPLTVAKGGSAAQSVDAPYFVDMVNDALQTRFQDINFQAQPFRIYTTLDLRLQRAASEAIRLGMESVDQLVKKQKRFRTEAPPDVQVALVALDPHTGEIKALAGGRNYGVSQLNHVLAKRQPGSIFKPFVYATALNTGLDSGAGKVFTPSSTIVDEPTTFWFDGKPYEPGNFGEEFRGTVTLREALAHSLNVATVKLAEQVGYSSVVDLANRAGMNYHIHATPAVALGAYEISPLEAAGAYTMFANSGERVKPYFLDVVRGLDGKVAYRSKVERDRVLDPRVAYLMTSLMEEVLRSGTAAGVRARGFTVPAAGKTGTSHDGWFAGYTSQLLCVVWVGFDDNRELNLEGAHSAAPIWGDFMKRALDYREYRDAQEFAAPEGIVSLEIDPVSGQPATSACPTRRSEVYIAGTQPVGACTLHGGGRGGSSTIISGWDAPGEGAAPAAGGDQGAGGAVPARPRRATAAAPAPHPPPQSQQSQQPQPASTGKKGLWDRVMDVFK
jgi:penicillin-binding protein 1B